MNLLTEENLIRLKVVLYGGLFFFSFFVIIAVPVTTNKLGGCVLYFDPSWGRDANCNYPVAIAVIFPLIYGLLRLISLVMLLLGQLSHDFVLFSDLFQLIFTAVDAVAFFLVLVSACVLSAGINKTCSQPSSSSQSCNDILGTIDESFASRIHVAEAGAWISFILWLVLVVVGVFWLFRQGKIPFLSQPARQSADGGTASASQVDTPPATVDSKY